jgi:ribosomal-protein-alanine N-acetyltransferase
VNAPSKSVAGGPAYSEELKGHGLVLRRMRADNVPPLYLGYLRDPEVIRYIQARFVEHTAESVRAFIAGFDHVDNFLFGIHAADDTFIGTATLRVNPVHRYSNLGYMIGAKDHWKGSTALDMCRLLLDFAFFERKVRKVMECTTENHLASNFNFKRLGFTLAAKIPDLYWGEGRYQAATYWTLDAADWAARTGRVAPEIPVPAIS